MLACILEHILLHVVIGALLKLCSRQTKITNFGPALQVDEHVRGFDVAVDDVCGVHEVERAEQVVHQHYHVVLGKCEAALLVKYFLEAGLLEFHDEENEVDGVWRFGIEVRRDHVEDVSGEAVTGYG